jgi:hypothetical protein
LKDDHFLEDPSRIKWLWALAMSQDKTQVEEGKEEMFRKIKKIIYKSGSPAFGDKSVHKIVCCLNTAHFSIIQTSLPNN